MFREPIGCGVVAFPNYGPTLGEDEDVIQVYHYKWVDEWLQDVIHQRHEGCRSIRQLEKHN